MAGKAPEIEIPELPEKRVAIISARWHSELCDQMIDGAQRALTMAKVSSEVFYVPGSFELPLAAKKLLAKDAPAGFDAAVVLGLVLRGETPHFDYVCQGVTNGVMDVSLELMKPIGFGVLTVDTLEQAIARTGGPGSKEDKGFDAAMAALALLKIAQK
jgi:6,7-dimethyl-8-ribityllumazine synthase